MPRLDARLGDYDASIGERYAGYFVGRLLAIDGAARYLSFGRAGQSKRLSRDDFRHGPASAICFGPKSAGGYVGGFDFSAALRPRLHRNTSFLLRPIPERYVTVR